MELGWRTHLLTPHISFSEKTDVYEFGVFTGKSMCEIANIFTNKRVPIRTFFGLDSFEGLPQETVEPMWQECWDKGDFNSQEYFGEDTAEMCINHIQASLRQAENNIVLKGTLNCYVKGFYEDTLNDNTVEMYGMKPASYIDIDVDIYSSTVTVLDFVFQKGIAVPGTLIGYDDWGGTPGWENYENGESRAHKEAEEKYGIDFELLGQFGNTFPHIARLYKVK